MIRPDPSISYGHLIVAPYISYSLQPDQAEVSATYGRGYPIHMQTLTPTPVTYSCPAAMPDQLSLLTESPYTEAITTIIECHLPTAHAAALKRYQHFQKEKYHAQAQIKGLKACLERANNEEYQALEQVMCIVSELENANFLGHLFCVEHEVLEQLTTHPNQADHFLRTALTFDGTITQSSLDPSPNLHRSAPSLISHLGSACHTETHANHTHTLTEGERDTLEEQALFLHTQALDIEHHLADDAKRHTCPLPHFAVAAANSRKHCFLCGHKGHIHLNCPKNRCPW